VFSFWRGGIRDVGRLFAVQRKVKTFEGELLSRTLDGDAGGLRRPAM
jgi:hypothetical protein